MASVALLTGWTLWAIFAPLWTQKWGWPVSGGFVVSGLAAWIFIDVTWSEFLVATLVAIAAFLMLRDPFENMLQTHSFTLGYLTLAGAAWVAIDTGLDWRLAVPTAAGLALVFTARVWAKQRAEKRAEIEERERRERAQRCPSYYDWRD